MLPPTHAHLGLPQLHPALETYRSVLETSMKPAWRLTCHQVDAIERTTTHIGGFTPYIPVQRGWPHCERCLNPLSFIWQLNFADFGAATFAAQGLFQFFYCWRCAPLPGLNDEYDFATLCRWYPDFRSDEAAMVSQVPCPYLNELTPDQVELAKPCQVDITPFLSVPSAVSDDHPIPEEVQAELLNVAGETFYRLYNRTPGLYLRDCLSQVSGYPVWVQDNDETPGCPVCSQRADLVGAVGSDETNLIWGDTGYWYIFACKCTEQCRGLNQPLMASQSL